MAVYLVTRDGAGPDEKPRMIEARTKPAAIAFAARSTFGAEPLTTKEAVNWSKQGVEIEDASAPDSE